MKVSGGRTSTSLPAGSPQRCPASGPSYLPVGETPTLTVESPHAARSALAPHRLAGAKPVACCRPTSTTGSPASTTARISASDEGALFRAISGAPANHEGGSHPAVAAAAGALREADDGGGGGPSERTTSLHPSTSRRVRSMKASCAARHRRRSARRLAPSSSACAPPPLASLLGRSLGAPSSAAAVRSSASASRTCSAAACTAPKLERRDVPRSRRPRPSYASTSPGCSASARS
mmetsp:Transcript_7014/g.20540  ORF Transcript_7014/g.20540 Transcript_7014/m.20540 type:complete len:235 (+) Transcript_7014:640-1344(+)